MPMSYKKYILAADSTQATVYAQQGHNKPLIEIKSFECPDCKLNNFELDSDRPGRATQQQSKRAKNLNTKMSRRERAIQIFAKELCGFLDQSRKENKYDELVLAASPNFLGILHKNLNEETSKKIKQNINKNLLKKSSELILRALNPPL
jgi:protein required for attachment to host cells